MSQGQLRVSEEGPQFRVCLSKAASRGWRGDAGRRPRRDGAGIRARGRGPRPSTAADGPGLCRVSPKRWKTFHSQEGEDDRVARHTRSPPGCSPANQLRTSQGQNTKDGVFCHVTVAVSLPVALGFCRLQCLLWPPWPRLGLD